MTSKGINFDIGLLSLDFLCRPNYELQDKIITVTTIKTLKRHN